jgi:hypothetical protein
MNIFEFSNLVDKTEVNVPVSCKKLFKLRFKNAISRAVCQPIMLKKRKKETRKHVEEWDKLEREKHMYQTSSTLETSDGLSKMMLVFSSTI